MVDGLVDAAEPEEVVLANAEVEENAVSVPGGSANHGTSNGVDNEMVGGGDNGSQDKSRIGQAEDDNGDSLPGAGAETSDGKGGDGETDEKRVTEVKRWHSSILVAEFVRGPHTALAIAAVDSVNKAKALGLGGIGAVVVGVAQQARGHAGPEREDEKGDEVAGGHGASSSLVQGGSSGNVVGLDTARQDTALAGSGEVEEHDQEKDSAGDMDEGVDAVNPMKDVGMGEEPLLDRQLPEDVQSLLEVDELKSMATGDIDSALDEGQCSDGTADLIDPVNLEPVPRLNEERKLLEDTAQEAVLEDERVGCGDDALVAEELQLATAQSRLLVSGESG